MPSPALYPHMGIVDKFLSGGKRTIQDYISLDSDDIEKTTAEAFQVHIAEIYDIEDVIAVKDKIYDGDLVIADITRLRTKDSVMNRITTELNQVAQEVGGDIVLSGDDQIIAAPAGVAINREKIGRK
tara:strand:+ start:6325 stop:6705 length:381 start_codon:yes stop_codon:yes gene_type:complete